MGVLYLTESDVEQLLDIGTAIDAVAEAFTRMSAGEVDNVPRRRAQSPGIVLHSMSAATPYCGLVGWKCYTTTREAAQFLVGVYDHVTGRLQALIEADRLGQLRTGATTAVAARWMALPEVAEMGLFGAGVQAAAQLEALVQVRPIKWAYVYCRNADRRREFARRMSQKLGIHVAPADRPQEAAEDLPLVVTATTSRKPVFDGNWLAEGAMVAAVGSNWLNKAEIDATTIRRADNLVCDNIAACQNEAGDFVDALEKGTFNWQKTVELADVVAGRAIGRSRAESITLFKSVGLAVEDVALAACLLKRAAAAGVGRQLPIGD